MSIQRWKLYLPKILGSGIVIAAGLAMVWMISEFSGQEQGKPKKKVQQVTLLKPPPPPPPPPKVERPPEPEIQEQVDIPEPEALEDLPDMSEPPPGDLLGLDADGAAGSDGFGLAARKGGRGLLSGDPNVIYASELLRLIEDALLDQSHVRKKAYSVVAKVWVSPGGSIQRAELVRSTGHEEIDNRLVDLILGVQTMAKAPPEGIPQPIKLKITSRL